VLPALCLEAAGPADARHTYPADVERNSKNDRAVAILAAAAHEFNDDLTIILAPFPNRWTRCRRPILR
jgi:hypothetical protein